MTISVLCSASLSFLPVSVFSFVSVVLPLCSSVTRYVYSISCEMVVRLLGLHTFKIVAATTKQELKYLAISLEYISNKTLYSYITGGLIM